MTSIVLDGNEYDHIIDTDFTESKLVHLPEWINDPTPDIDTNLWTRKIGVITYTLRVTDSEKWTLDQLLAGHIKFDFEDPTYDIKALSWMKSINAEYEADINWSKPWRVTVELIVIEQFPEWVGYLLPVDWGYFKLFGEIWFNEESGGYSGYPIYITDPFAMQGGGYEYKIGLVHYELLTDVNNHLWGSVGKDGTYNAWCRDKQTCYWFTHTTAYPLEGYHFDHWVLDGVTHDENPITVNTTIHNVAIFKNLMAYFAAN